MKRPRIYIDTSVIGFKAGLFKPLLSDVLAAELTDAPKEVREKYEEILQAEYELLATGPEAIELADGYQRRKILTPKYYDDGLHIAIASVAEADLLVSWNFRHIVRFDKIRLFNSVNLELGYKALQIYSPREVTTLEGA